MFKRIFKRDKSRVYLGSISVAPRSDIKRHFNNIGLLDHQSAKELEESVHAKLLEIFNLPLASALEEIKNSDLGLDILVPNHQLGNYIPANLYYFGMIGFWRPKVQIAARLYNLKKGKTIHTETVTVKMPWHEYIDRMLSWRGLTGIKPMFDSADMEPLLYRASLNLVSRLKDIA